MSAEVSPAAQYKRTKNFMKFMIMDARDDQCK